MKIIIIKPFEIVPGRILPPGPEVFEMENEHALRAITEGKGKRYGQEIESRVIQLEEKKVKTKHKEK